MDDEAEEKIKVMVARYRASLLDTGFSDRKIEEMVAKYEAGIRRMGRLYLGKKILFEEG